MSESRLPFEILLDPGSVAIVGLSDDAAKHGGRVLGHLQRLAFRGQVWGVNPRLPEVPGVEMFESLDKLPAAPDVVVCAVPAAAAVEVAAGAGRIGAGVLVVFAGGFSEAGDDGRDLQEKLSVARSEGGVRILGPNSGGVIRPGAGVALSFLTCLDRPADQVRTGPVGLVSQSGGTASYLHNLAAARGSGLWASISTGNEVDLDAAGAISALADRPEVLVIGLIVETVRKGPEFLSALRKAREVGKPVVACRLGRSEQGRKLMVTHTGAVAGPTLVLDGVLVAEGVTIAETPGDLLDIAEAMAHLNVPSGDRIGVVTHSGGIAILLSDLAAAAGLELPPPGHDLREELVPLLELGAVDNPLDMGGIIGGPHRFARVVQAFARSHDYDMVLAVSTPHPPGHAAERARDLLSLDFSQPVVNLWMAGDVGRPGLDALRAGGAAVIEEPRAAIAALAGLGGLAGRPKEVVLPPATIKIDEVGTLSEHHSKLLLAGLGIPVVEGGLATTPAEAMAIAHRIGFPVVAKISSPQILHKTEIDGIRVGIRDEAGLRAAFEEVMAAGQRIGQALIAGVRVERSISGLEIIVGGVRDSTFGPIVMVGLGGVLTEALGQVAVAPAPVDVNGALRMIGRMPGRRVLHSSRAGPPPDVSGLAAIVVRIGDILSGSDLEEIEVNPLTWDGTSWVGLDALVRGRAARAWENL